MSTPIIRTTDRDLAALSARLTVPLPGNFICHATLRELSAATGAASVVLTGPSGAEEVFTGTIRRGDTWSGAGELKLVIVGGAGGLAGAIGPLDHASPGGVPALLVAQGIASAAGETLAASVAAELAGLTLPRWTRAAGTGLEAIGLLAAELSLSWCMLDTGEIWIGAPTWAEVDSAAELGDEPMDEDHDDGRFEGRPDAATLRPGVTLRGRRVERVAFRCGSDAFAVEALYQVTGEAPRDLAPRVYREVHPARVVAQNADDTLELELDDVRLPGMSAVPFRCGIPGARLTIPAGSLVRVAFEGGSPTGAFAFALSQDPGAAKGVVRVGDAGVGGSFSAVGVAPGAPIQFVYIGPDGVPGAPGSSVSIVTRATQGSSEVKIR